MFEHLRAVEFYVLFCISSVFLISLIPNESHFVWKTVKLFFDSLDSMC